VNTGVPGFFGKVTSHGDFVTRRLPPELVAAWDGWLQQCIQTSKEQLGGLWLNHYLTSPIWRFAAAPGVLGVDGWAGVMMPSVDRVGRHFPLMLGAPLAVGCSLLACVSQGRDWYDALEDLARDSLGERFALDAFDRALAALVLAGDGGGAAATSGPWRLPMGERDAVPEGIADLLLQGHSIWWSEGSPSVAPSLLVMRGLPAPQSFAAMLDGSWQECGWNVVPGR